jgi:uncharacterized protein (TIGR02996 family)
MSRDRVAGILSAVRAAPRDDAPRLVLADFYEENGHVERARFIRSQLERAALPRWDARVLALDLDERAILAEHEDAWHAELPEIEGVRYGGFERGLVGQLLFDDAALVPQHIEAAMAACPATGIVMRWPRLDARPKLGAIDGLRALTVVGTLLQSGDLAWLAESPILSTIEELNLLNSRLDDDAFGVLLDSPHLGGLRRLRLPFHQLGNDGIERLRESSLSELVELDLSVETQDRVGSGGRDGPIITGDGVIALCAWSGMAKVERLSLTGNQIGEMGLIAILASKNTRRLKALRIRSVSDFDFENESRPDVLNGFQHSQKDRRLEELDIGENELTAEAVFELARSPALAELRMFSFDFHQPGFFGGGQDHLPKLLDAPWLDAVHVLSMRETSLPAVKKVLARAPASLHTISLASGFVWSNLQGIDRTLAEAPAQKALRSLDLRGCDVDDDALERLGAVTTLPSLVELRLGPNTDAYFDEQEPAFSEEAAEAFLLSALGQQLRSVVFGMDGIDRLPPPLRIAMGDAGHDDDAF